MEDKEIQKLQTLMQLWRNAKQDNSIAADKMIEEANKTEAGLRNLQFVLSTFLFTFTTPFFAKNAPADHNVKLLIFLAWIFILFSIIAGFIHMIEAIRFFLKQAAFHTQKVKKFSHIGTVNDYQVAIEETNALNPEGIPASPQTPLIIQSLLLFIGFVLIFSAATIILFK